MVNGKHYKNISYKRGPRHPSCNWAPSFIGPALNTYDTYIYTYSFILNNLKLISFYNLYDKNDISTDRIYVCFIYLINVISTIARMFLVLLPIVKVYYCINYNTVYKLIFFPISLILTIFPIFLLIFFIFHSPIYTGWKH